MTAKSAAARRAQLRRERLWRIVNLALAGVSVVLTVSVTLWALRQFAIVREGWAWAASVPLRAWGVVVLLAAIFAMWTYFQREVEGYEFVEVFKGTDGKASFDKHAGAIAIMLVIWQVISGELQGRDMTNLTLGMLGIVLGARAVSLGMGSIGQGLGQRPAPLINAPSAEITATPAPEPGRPPLPPITKR
jgi:O-antigen/teichoic acid export membrane protein